MRQLDILGWWYSKWVDASNVSNMGNPTHLETSEKTCAYDSYISRSYDNFFQAKGWGEEMSLLADEEAKEEVDGTFQF